MCIDYPMEPFPSPPLELFGGVLLILVLGIVYEGLKTLREILAGVEAKQQAASQTINTERSETTPLVAVQAKKTG